MKSKWFTATGVALGVALLLAVNIFSNAAFTSLRLDLTQNRLYTLSEGTRKVLAGLEEPVRLRLFLSRKPAIRLPSISSYAKRVQELLGEYVHAANGKLVLTVIDPSADDFELVGLPKGAQIKDVYAVNGIGNGLTNLSLDDVKSASAG